MKRTLQEEPVLNDTDSSERTVNVQFIDSQGNDRRDIIKLNTEMKVHQLNGIINQMVKNDEDVPTRYSFFITNNVDNEVESFTNGASIVTSINEAIKNSNYLRTVYKYDENKTVETTMRIVFHPLATFMVKEIARCTASVNINDQPVLSAHFSPDGRYLATGGTDSVVKFWNLTVQMPNKSSDTTGHDGSIHHCVWSPDGKTLATGDSSGLIILWNKEKNDWIENGKLKKHIMGSAKLIHSVVWKPLHLDGNCKLLAVSYYDQNVWIWDTVRREKVFLLSGFGNRVRALGWSGDNVLVCAVVGGTIQTWNPDNGQLINKFTEHCRTDYLNSVHFNTSFAMRCGAFDPSEMNSIGKYDDYTPDQLQEKALKVYKKARNNTRERMVISSDDKTMTLWYTNGTKPIKKLFGHQGPVLSAKFSPNGLLISSVSFDKSVRIWDGLTGEWLATLECHLRELTVQVWSPDSRFLVSAGYDTKVSLWTMKQIRGLLKPIDQIPELQSIKKKNTAPNCKRVKISHFAKSLPGHAGLVCQVDWSPDGSTVVSVSKDGFVKLWRN